MAAIHFSRVEIIEMIIFEKSCNMDLQTRKIQFIQEFLKIQSEEAISQFEKLLGQRIKPKENSFEPMTIEELNNRINKSEADFNSKRFRSSAEILSKYSK
jgi:chemotaxis protein CheY-P-specific phosphatase CheC